MFLSSLKIENETHLIREIPFRKGINLIIDETKTDDIKESGNNVGKTSVLRLIDFCLGGKGENIYRDPEFKNKGNSQIEEFLTKNNIVITLSLKDDIDLEGSREILIKRNFLKGKQKILEINNEKILSKNFSDKLKELIFHSSKDKPTFRQIISKNIRDEKNRLQNTVRVLHPTTKQEEYEALYLFWFGVDLDVSDRKQRLFSQKKIEDGLQRRLKTECSLSQIRQTLLVINRSIDELTDKKDSFNINSNYDSDVIAINAIKADLNRQYTRLSRLEMRSELIMESANELDSEISTVDVARIQSLYFEAKSLIPNLQKTFEETLSFHNGMVLEKKKYISMEMPALKIDIEQSKKTIESLLEEERRLANLLKTSVALEGFQDVVLKLNEAYEKKGGLEEQKRLWENSIEKSESIDNELAEIDSGISSLDETIQERVSEFNKYFSDISSRLYGEPFVLSPEKNDKGYELSIGSVSGNLGTGKKKGQMAAFDLAYIQFADESNIDCLHFILQDQIENIHDNQISSILTTIVSEVNCQYVLPVLRDKLPADIDISKYQVLSLSQDDKLFKV